MLSRYVFRCAFARRVLSSTACLALLTGLAAVSNAGFLVGTVESPQDNESVVVGMINDYNASNDPDLPTDIELFKKTDDDSAFVFNSANGFAFYKDALLTMPILTENDLQMESLAYFTYSGTENLLYYSVKAGQNVSLSTYMPGANLIDIPNANNNISHVSFWNSTSDPFNVPEPATLTLAGCGLAGIIFARRFCRRS